MGDRPDTMLLSMLRDKLFVLVYAACKCSRCLCVASATVGGKGGGGRLDLAQAGAPDGGLAEAALQAVRGLLAPQES